MLLPALALGAASCEKDVAKEEETAFVPAVGKSLGPAALPGTWELRWAFGGFAWQSYDYPPGNGHVWKITADNYQVLRNGQVMESNTYTLTKDSSMATGQLMDAMVLAPYRRQVYFTVTKDTLTLYHGHIAADGTIEKYVKTELVR